MSAFVEEVDERFQRLLSKFQPSTHCFQSPALRWSFNRGHDRDGQDGHHSSSPPITRSNTETQHLPMEIILKIISEVDDIPSLVSFALTSRRHHDIVLQRFQVPRLNKICPKDVRARFPSLLEPYVYNILCPKDNNGGYEYGWYVDNYRAIPGSAAHRFLYIDLEYERLRKYFIRKYVYHLSFIRRLTWVAQEAGAIPDNDKPGEMLQPSAGVMTQILRNETESGFTGAIFDFPHEVNAYISEYCQDYEFERLIIEDGPDPLPYDAPGIAKILTRPVVHSVEHLVLMELLKDWLAGLRERIQTPANGKARRSRTSLFKIF